MTNVTNGAEINATLSDFLDYYTSIASHAICAVLSIMLNTLVLCISFRKEFKLSKFQYVYFIINLALTDLLFSVFASVQGGAHGKAASINEVLCNIIGFLSGIFTLHMLQSLPLLSYCRYVKLCRPQKYAKRFTKRGCITLCLCVLSLSVFEVSLLQLGGRIGLYYYSKLRPICYILKNPNEPNIWLYFSRVFNPSAVILSFVLSGWFNWKVHKKIKQMHRNVVNLNQKKRVEEARQLLKVAVLQALPPLVALIPGIVDSILRASGYSHLPMAPLTTTLSMMNPVIDAVTSLYIIKPYRHAAVDWLKGLRRCKCELKVTLDCSQAQATR